LNNITAGVREREDANRTREAGHLDEIHGVMANILNLLCNGASLLANTFGVGLIDWLDDFIDMQADVLNAFATAVSNDNIR
jgi:hypothetical protein